MNSAFRTQRWVGIQPLKKVLIEQELQEPRLFLAKIYESLNLVLDSLWSHHLRFESDEILSLLSQDGNDTLINLLEQRSDFLFTSHQLLSDVKSYIEKRQSKIYPGHGIVCLFILARAKGEAEISAAGDLCESLSESLQIVESHLNNKIDNIAARSTLISRLIKRWKRVFPFSE